jgi:FKBP-type peptidyl-prolyl cis-trans isomerase FklB
MKLVLIVLLAVGFFAFSGCSQQDMSGKRVELNNEIDSVSYSLGVNIGKNIKSQGVDELNVNALANAMNDVFGDDSLEIDEMTSNMVIQNYFESLQSSRAEDSREKGLAFLEENRGRENIVATESGLQYEVMEEGSGSIPKEDDTVTVHYEGKTIDGKVFDSSMERGEPVSFPVSGVIQGWQEALQLMPVGSKWRIYVPSDLAYGERGAGRDIGPNETLIFDVELLSID